MKPVIGHGRSSVCRCRQVRKARKHFARCYCLCYDRSRIMLPTPGDALTAEQVCDLEEIVADTAAPDVMRKAARRVLGDPTHPVRACADDVRTALTRIDESVTQEDIERDVRQASEEVRQERLRQHAELRTGIA
jgi:hypothetical protein